MVATPGQRPGGTEPLGDGPQLLVRRYGRAVGYYATVGDLASIGVEWTRMAVAARW